MKPYNSLDINRSIQRTIILHLWLFFFSIKGCCVPKRTKFDFRMYLMWAVERKLIYFSVFNEKVLCVNGQDLILIECFFPKVVKLECIQLTKLFIPLPIFCNLLKLICHSLQEGLERPAKVTGQVVISSTQLSVNIRKRGSWGTNGHRLGIICYIEGACSYK